MRLIRRVFLPVAALILTACLSGCGYTTRSAIADNFKTIYVKQVVNKIDITNESDVANKYKLYRPGLESDISRAVIDKFLSDGNLLPVKSQDADLTLIAELIEFRKEPLRYTENDEVEEYRVNIVMNLTLIDNKKQETVWEEKYFTGSKSYFTLGPTAKSEATAINEALDDLSRRIVERTVEAW